MTIACTLGALLARCVGRPCIGPVPWRPEARDGPAEVQGNGPIVPGSGVGERRCVTSYRKVADVDVIAPPCRGRPRRRRCSRGRRAVRPRAAAPERLHSRLAGRLLQRRVERQLLGRPGPALLGPDGSRAVAARARLRLPAARVLAREPRLLPEPGEPAPALLSVARATRPRFARGLSAREPRGGHLQRAEMSPTLTRPE